MHFILYQPAPVDRIADSLGEPDYSYYFVMRGFQRVFERLGTVHVVTDPDREVDALYDRAKAEGEDALFVCCAPPHRCPVDLRCPTTSLFAWEFESIPDEVWGDDPRQDWRYVFARHGRAITLSRSSARVVKEAMGDDFPVAAIPVPVHDERPVGWSPSPVPLREPTELTIEGIVLDANEFCRSDAGLADVPPTPWNGDPIEMEFRAGERNAAVLTGFYEGEHWGTWSRVADPTITLPYAIFGPVRLALEASAYGRNVGRPLTLRIGEVSREVTLGPVTGRVEVELELAAPTNTIRFSGIELTPPAGAHDPRTMGIGLTGLRIERPGHVDAAGFPASEEERPAMSLRLDGVVYASVLNPLDGRKNWEDLLSGFIWAFRDVPDATLVLKMTHHDPFAYLNTLRALLLRHMPFKCRIMAVHGYLDDASYRDLRQATTYYVNASTGEGLCLPLMEFMSCGTPCIAPANTAMLDYVSRKNGFVVECWREHNVWPTDPRHLYRTARYRLDWESLYHAYRDSYRVAKQEEATYEGLGREAAATMERFASDDVVQDRLEAFILGKLAVG